MEETGDIYCNECGADVSGSKQVKILQNKLDRALVELDNLRIADYACSKSCACLDRTRDRIVQALEIIENGF